MKRILCLILLAVICCCLSQAGSAETALIDVHCEEQGYTTKMPAGASTTFQEGNGLRIWLDEPGYVPNVLIWRRDGHLDDPDNYVRKEFTDSMKKTYGKNLVGTTLYEYYDIGGKRLLGAAYIYKGASGASINQLHLVEVREDHDVEYNARYLNSEREMTLAALEAAVRYYEPDPMETGDDLVEIHCTEQGYTTRMPKGLSTTFQEGNGLRIWVDEPGYVPNVLIWRRNNSLADPETYVKNEYPEYMKKQYGDRLVGTTLYEYYDIGGKRLLGASYIYRGSSGASINQLHLVEVRKDRDVEYNARYLNSEREATLAALDAAVRYYEPDTEGTARHATSGKSSGKQLSVTASQPIITGTTTYRDTRFTMTLPKNWTILTAGEYTVFCYKAWDPANPDRSIFMYMKLEPFLKSQEAKNMYQRIANSGGGSLYQFSADAPVMKSCDLLGFLNAMPDTITFAAKYYQSGLTINPAVLPKMKNVRMLEKTPSSIPCPDTCKENVIGRITFDDYEGNACEGLVTAQPLDVMQYMMYGVDAWPYTVYLFMGVTAPVGELNELEPVLTECLSSFNFDSSYVRQAINVSNEETQALLEYNRQMQAAHDAMVDAWSARQKSYDIISQKTSDAILGYDRLYDSETGEIYRAETGFYDSYNLHRDEYSNSNLQLIDSSSQQYYLIGIDYYITR